MYIPYAEVISPLVFYNSILEKFFLSILLVTNYKIVFFTQKICINLVDLTLENFKFMRSAKFLSHPYTIKYISHKLIF